MSGVPIRAQGPLKADVQAPPRPGAPPTLFGLDAEDHRDLVTNLRARLQRRWCTAEDLLSRTRGPWLLGGDALTLADLAATPLAVRLPSWKPELVPDPDAFPRVDAWLTSLRERPSSAEVDRRGISTGDQ